MEIIPAIIGKDFKEVKEKVQQVGGLVRWVHLDVMDGLFTPSESWPHFDMKESPADLRYIDFVRTDNLKTEVHLMVKHPEKNLSKWIEAGSDRVVIHYEAIIDETITGMLRELENAEVEAGLALLLETPIDVLDKYIDQLDLVQLMSIGQIGFYGRPFEEAVYEKIRALREKYPGVTISVDGGVNLQNIADLARAGADNMVVGSAIFKSEDPQSAVRDFQRLLSEIASSQSSSQ